MSKSSKTSDPDHLTVGLAQVAPVWLQREATLAKILLQVEAAARAGCQLVCFGETLLPGYPFWIERTDGARFNSPAQKQMHAHYLDQAVQIERGDLQPLCDAARTLGIAIVLGVAERPLDRGGHSVYCSMVVVNPAGEIASVHRKLMPTYEERLVWAQGDGHGLRVQRLGAFTMGGLNCWENWMPLPRAALYGLGEDLHVALWPGGAHNTHDITRFIAREGRSYVLSVCGLMRPDDIPHDTPLRERILADAPAFLADGGSCVAGPDGEWVLAPVIGEETLLVATLDHRRVREERQNFDAAGHYARPDVTQLTVDRRRQSTVLTKD